MSDQAPNLITLTFTFDIHRGFLDGLDDFDRRRKKGITVASVAAAVIRHHDARHGYVHWTIGTPSAEVDKWRNIADDLADALEPFDFTEPRGRELFDQLAAHLQRRTAALARYREAVN